MTIISKRNVVLMAPDGRTAYPIAKGYIGSVPEWAAYNRHFQRLVADGLIAVAESTKDAAMEEADEKAAAKEAGARARAKKQAEKAEEPEKRRLKIEPKSE